MIEWFRSRKKLIKEIEDLGKMLTDARSAVNNAWSWERSSEQAIEQYKDEVIHLKDLIQAKEMVIQKLQLELKELKQ